MKNPMKKPLDAFQQQELSVPQQKQVKGGTDTTPIIVTDIINEHKP